jgi:hypothetical protein
MNQRPTPETDGIEFHAMAGMMPPYNTVPADFARRLERERDEAREELEDWRNAAKGAENPHPDEVHCACVPLLHKLLKEARAEIARLRDIEP